MPGFAVLFERTAAIAAAAKGIEVEAEATVQGSDRDDVPNSRAADVGCQEVDVGWRSRLLAA